MLFLPFTKNWWSAFVRGDDSQPGRVEDEGGLRADGADGGEERRDPGDRGRGRRSDDRPGDRARRDRGPRNDDSAGRGPRGRDLAAGRPVRADSDSAAEDSLEERAEEELEDSDQEDGAEGSEGTVIARGDLNEEDDPLAPAYDLDHGDPLDDRGPSTRGIVADRLEVRSAKEFFNGEILYRFDILDSESRRELAGTYRVELKGYSGGIWTINVGDEMTVVNRREDADVVLTMQQRDFLQLVNGEINPQLAIVAQKLRLSGDIRKGVTAQILFSPLGE